MPSLHSLGYNLLKDEGTIIVCNALKDSKVSKLKELVLNGNGITATGAASVAAYLAISAELTVVNVLNNELNVESASMLAEVAKQKGISLCGIKPDQTTADFSVQGLKPADAILLASDLSQAGVSAELTKIE